MELSPAAFLPIFGKFKILCMRWMEERERENEESEGEVIG